MKITINCVTLFSMKNLLFSLLLLLLFSGTQSSHADDGSWISSGAPKSKTDGGETDEGSEQEDKQGDKEGKEDKAEGN